MTSNLSMDNAFKDNTFRENSFHDHSFNENKFHFEISTFQDIVIFDLHGSADREGLEKLEIILNMMLEQKKNLLLLNFKKVLNFAKTNLDLLIDYNEKFELLGGAIAICSFKTDILDGKIPELKIKYLTMISKKINFFDSETEAVDFFNTDLSKTQEHILTPELLNVNRTVYLSREENIKGFPFFVKDYSHQHITLSFQGAIPPEIETENNLFLRYLSPRGVHSVRVKQQDFQGFTNKGEPILTLFFPQVNSVNINRKYRRYNIRILADYTTYQELLDNPEITMKEGITRNISSEGTLIETSHQYAQGTLLALSFRLGKTKIRLCLGEVVRVFSLTAENSGPKTGLNTPDIPINSGPQKNKFALGIKFKALFPEDRESIFNHIMSLTSGKKSSAL